MGTGGSRSRRVWVGAVATVLVCAAVGSRRESQTGLTPLFWADGDSWTAPTRCMNCGSHLQRLDSTFVACPECGLRISVPEQSSIATVASSLTD